MRLVDGGSELEGRVEICFGGIWGTICNSSHVGVEFDELAAVVCRQLGFSPWSKHKTSTLTPTLCDLYRIYTLMQMLMVNFLDQEQGLYFWTMFSVLDQNYCLLAALTQELTALSALIIMMLESSVKVMKQELIYYLILHCCFGCR